MYEMLHLLVRMYLHFYKIKCTFAAFFYKSNIMKSVKCLSIALFLALSCSAMADGIQLWQGGKALNKDRDNIFISRVEFAQAKPGDCIHISQGNTIGEGRHSVYLGDYDTNPLPGVDDRTLKTESFPTKFYLTADMLNAIVAGEKDVRLYGENATVSEVRLEYENHTQKSGRVLWTGFFWMDSWTTLDLYKQAFSGLNLNDYKAIRFYSEAGRTDYVINVVTKFDSEHKLGDQSTMTMINEYAELHLTDDIRTKISAMLSEQDGKLYIQCNKETGAAFNFTDVVLIPNDPVDPCTNCFSINIH